MSILKKTEFQKLELFQSLGEKMGAPTLLSPLDRPNWINPVI
jgi:hypothetical protein